MVVTIGRVAGVQANEYSAWAGEYYVAEALPLMFYGGFHSLLNVDSCQE